MTMQLGEDRPQTRIIARVESPLAIVELGDIWVAKQHYSARPRDNVVEIALSERPGPPRVHFPQRPALGSHPVGEIIFVPADCVVDSDLIPGRQQVLRCFYRRELDGALREWTGEELLAALDIRNLTVRNALLRIAEEMSAPRFRSSMLIDSLVTIVAVELGRYFRRQGDCPLPGRLSAKQLQQIDTYIERERPMPSASELAAELGLSTRHFFRLFRQTTGYTLVDYTTQRRIERAKSLLREQGLIVKQVAHRCGFQAPAAFSAAFRRETGMTPKEYRQSLEN